jgi:PEP-CTERM motif
MVRTLTVVIGLAMSLMVARDAWAIPILPVDLDSWSGGSSVIGSFDDFRIVTATPRPRSNRNEVFRTDFSVGGFSGIVGWSFSDARRAGGTGTDSDFRINYSSGRLFWTAAFRQNEKIGWGPLDPIAFFFVSSRSPFTTLTPPGAEAKPYSLLSDEVFTGTAQSLAPVVPEPGMIALFGSGLVGLYAAMRRRQRAKG